MSYRSLCWMMPSLHGFSHEALCFVSIRLTHTLQEGGYVRTSRRWDDNRCFDTFFGLSLIHIRQHSVTQGLNKSTILSFSVRIKYSPSAPQPSYWTSCITANPCLLSSPDSFVRYFAQMLNVRSLVFASCSVGNNAPCTKHLVLIKSHSKDWSLNRWTILNKPSW